MAGDSRPGSDRERATAAQRARAAVDALPAAAARLREAADVLLRLAESRSASAAEITNATVQTCDRVTTHILEEKKDVAPAIRLVQALMELLLADVLDAKTRSGAAEEAWCAWEATLRRSITCVSHTLTDLPKSTSKQVYALVHAHLVGCWAQLAQASIRPQEGLGHLESDVAVDALLQIATLDKPQRADILKHISVEDLGRIFCITPDYNVAADAMEIALLTKPKGVSSVKRRHWEAFMEPWRAETHGHVAGISSSKTQVQEQMREGYESVLKSLVELKNEGKFDSIVADAISYWSLGDPKRPQNILCRSIQNEQKSSWLFAKPLNFETASQPTRSTKAKVQEEFMIWINSHSLSIDFIDPAFVEDLDSQANITRQQLQFEKLKMVTVDVDQATINIEAEDAIMLESSEDNDYVLGTKLLLRAKDDTEAKKFLDAVRSRCAPFTFAVKEIAEQRGDKQMLGTTDKQLSVPSLFKSIAAQLSRCPPALANRGGAMAKSAIVCRLPDHPRLPELSPNASQAEVRRGRVDELQRATGQELDDDDLPILGGDDAMEAVVDQVAHDDDHQGGGDIEASSPPGHEHNSVQTRSKRASNSIRRKLNMSDSPSAAHSALPSEADKTKVQSRSSVLAALCRTSTPAQRRTAAPSSDLSELSEDDPESPSIRFQHRRRERKGDASPTAPMRKLSLMVPQKTKRPNDVQYKARKGHSSEQIHQSDEDGDLSGSEAAQAEKYPTSKPKELAKEKQPARADKKSQAPIEHDDIDYDAIPGAEADEPVEPKAAGKSRKKKDAGKTKQQAKAVEKNDDSHEQKKEIAATKRKATEVEKPAKKPKKSHGGHGQKKVVTKGQANTRPVRKARAAATKKNKALLDSSDAEHESDGSDTTTKRLKKKPIREESDDEQPFLAAAISSTPQGSESAQKVVPTRPVHPWNHPSQQSQQDGKDKAAKSTKLLNDERKASKHAASAFEGKAQDKDLQAQPAPSEPSENQLADMPRAGSPLAFEAILEAERLAIAAAGATAEGADDMVGDADALHSEAAVMTFESTILLRPHDNDALDAQMDVDVPAPPAIAEQPPDGIEPQPQEKSMWKSFTTLHSPVAMGSADDHPGDVAVDKGSHPLAGAAKELRGSQDKAIEREQLLQLEQGAETVPIAKKPSGPSAKRPDTAKSNAKAAQTKEQDERPEANAQPTESSMDDQPVAPSKAKAVPSARIEKPPARDAEIETPSVEKEQGMPSKAIPKAIRELDFSTIDVCAESPTLVEPKSASAPVPKLHVNRRALSDGMTRNAKLAKEIRLGRDEEDDSANKGQTIASSEQSARRDDEPEKAPKAPRQPRMLETKRPIGFAKTLKAAATQVDDDPALAAALLLARKSRKSAAELRHGREEAQRGVEEKEHVRRGTIEDLAAEFGKVICQAEMNEIRGVKLEARHDLRKLMQDMFTELSAVEELNVEAARTIARLRDCREASRQKLLRTSAGVRKHVAETEGMLKGLLSTLEKRL
ncbi:hypothetical protein OC844_004206 [Tilletia horrida]|nr:hypothetical protein OC844_004206 [Tilletia horrida]